MKFLLLTISIFSLISCGGSSNNSNNKSPEVIDSIKPLTNAEIEKACGSGNRGMSILGQWTSDLIEDRYPKMVLEFEFHNTGKAEISVLCRVEPESPEIINPGYNEKMTQVGFSVDGNNLTFGNSGPIELTLEEDSTKCILNDISGDHMIGSLGECLTIDIDNQTIYLKRD